MDTKRFLTTSIPVLEPYLHLPWTQSRDVARQPLALLCVWMSLTGEFVHKVSRLCMGQSDSPVSLVAIAHRKNSNLKRFILRFSANLSAPDLEPSAPSRASSSSPEDEARSSSSPASCSASVKTTCGVYWEAGLAKAEGWPRAPA